MKFFGDALLPILILCPTLVVRSAEQSGGLRSHPPPAAATAAAFLQHDQDGRRHLQECAGSDPQSCGCDSALQADYRGPIAVTVSGRTCQRWDEQIPHRHSRTPENYPSSGLEDDNACRNPDGEPGAWCYTTDENRRWELCDVPSCAPPPPPATPGPTDQPTPGPTTAQPTTGDGDGPLPVCSTPELTSLESLTSDLRAVYQNAGLPTITGGTSSSSSAASTSCETSLARKRVLMIGIDGLRADVVGMTPLPAFRRLQSMGTYSYWADVQSSASAVSGPGWTSMFTGVQPSRHGVTSNSDLNDIAYPTVFKMAKDAFGLKVAASVSWNPLVTDIIDHEDDTTLDATFLASGNDAAMAARAEEWILGEQYDFVFVDFDGPDAAGHSTGFDGYASAYRNRVVSTDALVGTLLDAVLTTSAGEEWLIVLTSDHGGEGTSHGPSDAYNRKIPFMVASNSPRVNVGFMPLEDPGSQMDVLPTVMHFLGGQGAVPEGLDGRVFGFGDYVRPPPPGSCVPDPESCGCDSSQQADYRGTVAETASGLECQAWDSQSPHSHDRTPDNYPSSGLEGNYCRNPDGEPGAWCYTTDPGTRWELCSVPSCATS